MGRLDFTVSGLDFADLPQFGPDSLFARLAGGGAKEMGYPALGPGDASHTSGSDLRDWAAAAEAVAAQNPTLRRPDQWTRYVVAGQQAGLLTGPMYTFLKAVSAISLARRLAKESGSPVLPLFWIASEDHDVLEVNRVTVNGRRFVHGYQGELARGKVPQVADIDITEARERGLRTSWPRPTFPATQRASATSWTEGSSTGRSFA